MGSKMKTQRHVDGGATHVSLGLWSNPTRVLATLLLTGAMAGLTVSAAFAEDPPPAAEAPEKAASIEPIVVTGSRIARRDYQSDSPIATIDESALAAAGQPTLDRAIGEFPQVTALLGGNSAADRGNMVLAFEYSERGVVHGADRPFFANIRELARPPEGIIPAGTFGTAPTIGAVNGVLAGYPGTTPIAGSGAYNGSLGVNTDGTIFTDLASPNCVQNYRGLGQLKGVNISPGCTTVQVGLGP